MEINEFICGRSTSVRVWDAPIRDPIESGFSCVHSIDLRSHRQSRSKFVGMEVAIPRGGFVSYGLLEGVVGGVAGERFDLEIVNAMASSPVVTGFPGLVSDCLEGDASEYYGAIVKGAARALGLVANVPAGYFRIVRVCCSRIGSSSAMFERLSFALGMLLLNEEATLRAVDVCASLGF